METGIYQINIGDYFYFGQSIDLNARNRRHKSELFNGNHCNTKMQNVFNKYNKYDFKVVLECSVEELDDQEQRLLDAFWGTEGCMNLCKDIGHSTRGFKISEDHKKKLSEANKGRKLSEDHKKKISNANLGKKLSKEHKDKISCSKKGISTRKGYRHSDETKNKMSKAQTGSLGSRYDHTRYNFIHKDGREEVCTQYELKVLYNLYQSHVNSVVLGKRKSTGGWRIK